MKRSEIYIRLNKKNYLLPLIGSFFLSSLTKEEKQLFECSKDSYFLNYRVTKDSTYFNILLKAFKSSLSYMKALIIDDDIKISRFNNFNKMLTEEYNNCLKLYNEGKEIDAIILLESMILGIIKYVDINNLEEIKIVRQK